MVDCNHNRKIKNEVDKLVDDDCTGRHVERIILATCGRIEELGQRLSKTGKRGNNHESPCNVVGVE